MLKTLCDDPVRLSDRQPHRNGPCVKGPCETPMSTAEQSPEAAEGTPQRAPGHTCDLQESHRGSHTGRGFVSSGDRATPRRFCGVEAREAEGAARAARHAAGVSAPELRCGSPSMAPQGPSATSCGSSRRCRPTCPCACWATTATWASTASSCPTTCVTSLTAWTGGCRPVARKPAAWDVLLSPPSLASRAPCSLLRAPPPTRQLPCPSHTGCGNPARGHGLGATEDGVEGAQGCGRGLRVARVGG